MYYMMLDKLQNVRFYVEPNLYHLVTSLASCRVSPFTIIIIFLGKYRINP